MTPIITTTFGSSMKSKHIFICEPEVHPSMRVYFVSLGVSQRDKRVLVSLQRCAAASPDAYFSIYNDNVVDFLRNLSMQVYDSLSPRRAWEKFFECNVRVVPATKILQSIGFC